MSIRVAALSGACVLSLGLISVPASALTFPVKLFLSQDGIALSKFPSHSGLKHTIMVDRTQGKGAVAWTASSDQPWLTVNPSGMTGGKLTVSASPKSLNKDQFYSANVTVSTNGADFTDSENLHVGLWVGKKDPGVIEVTENAVSIATNPVSPIAYVSDGAANVQQYNVYSGAVVGTFKNAAASVGYMEVSSDGGTLFVDDATNNKIVAIDTATGDKIGKYAIPTNLQYGSNMVYARPYGQPAIFPTGGPAYAVPSGEVLFNTLDYLAFAATPDGQKLYGVDIGIDPATIYAYSLKLNKGMLAMSQTGSATISGENCQDLAVSHDGKHLYPACGAPYEFDVYDGKSLVQVQTLPAAPYPNNAEIDENDNFVGGINGLYETDDVFVYKQNGFNIGNVPTTDESYSTGQADTIMKVSGDGTRVVSEAGFGSNTLMFRSLP